MLVKGGAFGWARLAGRVVVSWGVVGLLVTAACGSRTSMLDPDAYEVGAGGTFTGPLGNAGKPSSSVGGRPVGIGGATTTPTAGAPSSGPVSNVDPSVAVGPCQQYCPGYGSQCKRRLKGQDCLATCQNELNGSGPTCQALGVQTLSCLAPFFSRGGGDCDGAVARALAQCGDIVAKFDACKKEFLRSPGNNPSLNFVGSCLRSGGPMSDGNCSQIFNCNNGPYVTFCNQATDGTMLLDCTCITPDGQTLVSRMLPSADPCLSATTLCQ